MLIKINIIDESNSILQSMRKTSFVQEDKTKPLL